MAILFGLIGGLGLFFFGMRSMSDGLQKTAGNRLRRLLEVLTTNRIAGVVMGAVVTALLQSSSTTTVMTVGFVNAGLMTLPQAVGVIMGANIGTTVTAQLIAFRLEEYTLPAVGIGVALLMFAKRERLRYIGQAIMGFGLLFLGLETMSDAVRPLRDWPQFSEMILAFANNPLLGILVGTGITVAVQSSSASIGLLQSMAAEGLVPIQSALPILFGDNIGTTITAVLSGIGASIAARRAAFVHVVFNLVGTILFLIALPLVTPLIIATSTDVVRQIANAHAIFNISNTIIQLPFAGAIVWLVLRLVPGKAGDVLAPEGPRHLDNRFLDTPPVAINLSRNELKEMAGYAREVVSLPLDALFAGKDGGALERAFETEKRVNALNRLITEYLTRLVGQDLTDRQSEAVNEVLNIVADVERVGDHGENIAELVTVSFEEKLPFTEAAMRELQDLASTALRAYDLALESWLQGDAQKAQQVFALEKEVDRMEKAIRAGHIERLNKAECHPTSGIIFLDMASNLERIADHAANIADLVKGN